jgi:hypothetical protein
MRIARERSPAPIQGPFGGGLGQRDLVPGRIRFSPTPGAVAALIEFVDLERECCAWVHLEVSAGSTVTLSAEGDGEAVLAGIFDETH